MAKISDTTCPVCGLENAFSEPNAWDICPQCNWEDDQIQRDEPDYWGGANQLSLNQSKQAWTEKLDVLILPFNIRLSPDRKKDAGTQPYEQLLHNLSLVVPEISVLDPSWAVLRQGSLIMEFVLDDVPAAHSIWVHIYGSGDALSILSVVCDRTGWKAFETLRREEPPPNLDLGGESSQSWRAWQETRDTTLRNRIERDEQEGKRLIFTTVSELRSNKPVRDFEDIRSLSDK